MPKPKYDPAYKYTEHEKQCAGVIDLLCPVIKEHTGAYISPDCFQALVLRLAEILEDGK